MIVCSKFDEYIFSFIDPEHSSWSSGIDYPKMLTRKQALQHAMSQEFFQIAEHVILNDRRINEALGSINTG